MADYRRSYVPGGTYFFTVVTYQRTPIFRDATARDILGEVMRAVADETAFETVAIVLLWEHLHCIWTLPPGDQDYSTRWKRIKTEFTKRWMSDGGTELSVAPAKQKRGRRGVWQPRFWEHTIRDEADLEAHFDYVHYNPAKHGYVTCPWDWPWSSFRRYVEAGHYNTDWGRTEPSALKKLDFE